MQSALGTVTAQHTRYLGPCTHMSPRENSFFQPSPRHHLLPAPTREEKPSPFPPRQKMLEPFAAGAGVRAGVGLCSTSSGRLNDRKASPTLFFTKVQSRQHISSHYATTTFTEWGSGGQGQTSHPPAQSLDTFERSKSTPSTCKPQRVNRGRGPRAVCWRAGSCASG